jgi:hypothetical protein
MAYNLFVIGSYATPMSALPCVKAGPVVHTPGAVVMSNRYVFVLFAEGTLGCAPLCNTELCATALGPLGSNPPTT